jgi:hypothetical protein
MHPEETYMMRRTPRDVRQLRVITQRSIKVVTLRLRAVVLPVGCVGVAQRASQEVLEGAAAAAAAAAGAAQQLLGVVVPVDAPVLLAGAADAPDAVQGRPVVPEAGEDQVDGLEPHGDGGKDLALVVVDEDALGQAILLAKVCIKVYLCLGEHLQVRLDDNGCCGV